MPDDNARFDFLWNVHSYLNEHIRFADTKAQLVIGWTSALIGALAAGGFQKTFAYTFSGSISFLGFFLLVVAFVCAFVAVIPRLNTTQMPGYIFWRSVLAHKSKDVFVAELGKLTAENLSDQLAGHIYDLSSISDRKFRWVNWSIVVGFLGSIVSGIMYLLG